MKLLQFWGVFFSVLVSIVTGIICYIWSKPFINWSNNSFNNGDPSPTQDMVTTIAFVCLGVLLGFLATSVIYNQMLKLRHRLQKTSAADKIVWLVGVIVAGAMAGTLTYIVHSITKSFYAALQTSLCILVFAFVMWLVIYVVISMKEELRYLFSAGKGDNNMASVAAEMNLNKIVDTNVIIDGRVYDILDTGFLEGKMLVPNFILEELQYIADSADPLKRGRGRRGLDILYKMQKEYGDRIEILDKINVIFAHNEAVDMKLVKLAANIPSTCLLTNDFNLNKVAKLNGVKVLNINELANALKPVILPGEEIDVLLIKEGKEADQGLGYLDDGTMVVVDHAASDIGKKVTVTVSSVLQTVAGKMIFADRYPSEELLQRLNQQ